MKNLKKESGNLTQKTKKNKPTAASFCRMAGVITELVAALGLSPLHVLIAQKLAEQPPSEWVSIHSLKITLGVERLEFDRILFDLSHLRIIYFSPGRNFVALDTYNLATTCSKVAARLHAEEPGTDSQRLQLLLTSVSPLTLHAPAQQFAPKPSTTPWLPPTPRPTSRL